MAVITDLTCVLPRPSITALHAALTTEFSQRLLGGAPVIAGSTEDVLSFVMAGTTNLMWGFVTQALKENDPATMCCDNLVRYAAIHGIDMLASTRSKGYAGITGVAGTPVPGNIRLVSGGSLEYKLDPSAMFNPTALDAAGAAVLRIVAVVAGAAYDLPPGSPLSVATTFPGIDNAATVLGSGLRGGSDDETCEHLRGRVIAAEAAGVIATNMAWYIQQSMTYPGVTRVCVDECEGCCDPSHIILYPFFNGVYGDVATPPYGVPPGPVLEQMTDWMFGPDQGMGGGLAPIGISGQFAAALPTIMDVTVNCFAGCPTDAHDRIVIALTAALQRYCVGSKICKEHLRAAAYAAVGPEACFSSIILNFDASLAREDDAFAYLACVHFAVLGTVTMVQGYN